MTADSGNQRRVRRRHVFYISGYDPRGPSHYHRLYKDEARKQAAINGLALDIGPRRSLDPFESTWRIGTGETVTDYRFLRYDDIMRSRWTKSNFGVLWEILRYTGKFLRRGVFARTLMVSWPTFVTIVYPVSLALLALLIALLAGWLTLVVAGWLAGAAVAIAVFIGLVQLRAPLEDKIAAFWLARILSFIADQGDGEIAGLDARLDIFAARLAVALGEDLDEVLLVGHSVGTQLVVSVAARAARLRPGARLSLLTLGHTIPLQSFQPMANVFRAELAAVAANPDIHWIDVSAAIDSACFPLTDPVAASGLAQTQREPSPKLVSARFPKLFTPLTYAKLRRQFSRAHFQYLMAAEIAGDYDYFLITAGDRTLADRFAHLKSVSNFTRFRLRKS